MIKRERFAVLGLGHFGAFAVQTLYQAGREILAVDIDREVVREAAEFATEAVTADVTDVEALRSIGAGEVDVAIISLGDRMDITALAVLHLKELGVPYIAVKALSEEHGRILKAIGASEIIHPEKDSAIRLAHRLARQDVVDYLPLVPGYSIVEIAAPPEFVGKTLRDLALRNRLEVQLIGIQRDGVLKIVPRADDIIQEGDLMMLLGADKDLDRIKEIGRS